MRASQYLFAFSAVTQELICDQRPDGVSLCNLGTQQFKDLIYIERIFQVVTCDLQADFPAIKTLDTHPNSL